ncbi:MAG: RNA methyltransferase, partial [Saprospiraceae bacterium]
MEYQLYPAQVAAVVQALRAIFEDKRKADRVLQEVLKADKRRGSRDRAFIAESTYDIVRHYRRLAFLRGGRPRTENEWWELWGVYWTDKTNQPPPRWRELSGMPPAGEVRERYEKVRADPALDESFPDWLFELGKRELGDDWLPAIKALNKTAEVVMRVNTLKTDREDLQRRLAADDIRTEPVGEVGLKLLKRANVFGHATFQLGWFEMQDASSQRVAQALAPEPGMTVVDACAGAGGKSLHIAALMNNKGRLIALDTEEWKLEELSKRARRAGVFIADTRAITSSKIVKRLDNKADRLLLDVPCSGLGVLR